MRIVPPTNIINLSERNPCVARRHQFPNINPYLPPPAPRHARRITATGHYVAASSENNKSVWPGEDKENFWNEFIFEPLERLLHLKGA
jgi:hypothetical protein